MHKQPPTAVALIWDSIRTRIQTWRQTSFGSKDADPPQKKTKNQKVHCKGIEPLAEAIDMPFGNQTVFGKLLCYHYTNSVFHFQVRKSKTIVTILARTELWFQSQSQIIDPNCISRAQ